MKQKIKLSGIRYSDLFGSNSWDDGIENKSKSRESLTVFSVNMVYNRSLQATLNNATNKSSSFIKQNPNERIRKIEFCERPEILMTEITEPRNAEKASISECPESNYYTVGAFKLNGNLKLRNLGCKMPNCRIFGNRNALITYHSNPRGRIVFSDKGYGMCFCNGSVDDNYKLARIGARRLQNAGAPISRLDNYRLTSVTMGMNCGTRLNLEKLEAKWDILNSDKTGLLVYSSKSEPFVTILLKHAKVRIVLHSNGGGVICGKTAEDVKDCEKQIRSFMRQIEME